jgi:hypothetical protein
MFQDQEPTQSRLVFVSEPNSADSQVESVIPTPTHNDEPNKHSAKHIFTPTYIICPVEATSMDMNPPQQALYTPEKLMRPTDEVVVQGHSVLPSKLQLRDTLLPRNAPTPTLQIEREVQHLISQWDALEKRWPAVEGFRAAHDALHTQVERLELTSVTQEALVGFLGKMESRMRGIETGLHSMNDKVEAQMKGLNGQAQMCSDRFAHVQEQIAVLPPTSTCGINHATG